MKTFQPVRFGKYLLLDQIAVGGMAELYRAKLTGDEGFEKLIAIKKILPHLAGEERLVESFIDEARLAAFLEHENIIRIYDFGKMETDLFIAMEYLSGKNLKETIDLSKQRCQPIGLEKTLYIIAAICKGLYYAHSLKNLKGEPFNIIHRDISPPNIFITYEGEVKIIDFGIAKASSQNTATQMGTIKGKVAYMSPEQAEGKALDPRSDIFAIGSILYEMITGKRLFEGDTFQILAKVRKADFKPPENIVKGLPMALRNIIIRALAKDLEDRYQTCWDMLLDVENCMHELGLRTSPWAFTSYIKDLFAREIDVEEKVMQTVAMVSDTSTFLEVQGIEETMFLSDMDALQEPLEKKICILGAVATGKTSILLRYIANKIPKNYNFTMGISRYSKTLNFDGKNIILSIWDFCGEDRVEKINIDFLAVMDGYFLVLDATRISTINSAISLHEKIELALGKLPFICLVNKTDLKDRTKIKRDAIDELVAKGWEVVVVSAKTGRGINGAFVSLIEKMLDN